MTADPVTADVVAPQRAMAALDSAPGDLPRGWVWTTLGEVTTFVRNGLPQRPDSAPPGHRILRINAVRPLKVDLDEVRYLNLPESAVAGYFVHDGDLLFTRYNGSVELLGVAGMVRNCTKPTLHPDKLIRVLSALDGQLAPYLELACNFGVSRAYIESKARTTAGQTGISGADLKHMPIPLPPLAEQRRIVAAIEQQFTRLDAGVAALRRAQAALKRYRAAVLKAAVEGRLTDDWRRAHPLADPQSAQADFAAARPPGAISIAGHGAGAGPVAADPNLATEPASAFLARILAERRARWESDLRARGKDPARTRYPEPAAPDSTGLPSLPDGWCWATAEQLSDETRAITYGVVKLGNRVEGGVPTLRSSNVRHLALELDGLKHISRGIADRYQRTYLRGGEILITVRGTLGGVVVAPAELAGANISREVAMLAPTDDAISPCAALFIGSPPVQAWIMRNTKGIAYTGINIETLKHLPLPIPPLAEQQAIVAEVERRLSVVVELEAAVTANLARAERLRQAILREAFAGRLVPQDPDDEPASALLERIRREWVEVSIPSGRRSARASNQGLRPPTLTERPAGDKTSMAGTARPVQQEVPWKE